jgi:GT2 family glycosyltransferase
VNEGLKSLDVCGAYSAEEVWMNSNSFISVIVPTCHRNDLLAKCLDSLAPGKQTLSSEWYEVIVTDDGSRTTAEQMLLKSYPWARWAPGPDKGPAANRNNGCRHARGQWLAFIDDDCLPDLHWLKAYAEAIVAHPSCRVFEGSVYADRPRRSLAEIAPVFERGGNLPSGNFICSKELFESLGGFDERFPYPAMEDIDLRIRLDEAGQSFSFIKSASVCHPWRAKGGWQHLKRHQQSTFIFLSIHPEEKSRIVAAYTLQEIWRSFSKNTVPGLIKFKGRGFGEAIMEHFAAFQMRFLLSRLKP